MAENRNITWNITLKIDPKVTTRFKLFLASQFLEHGKFMSNPPGEISVPEGKSETKISFTSAGRACTATGTQGEVLYKSSDSEKDPSEFKFSWEVPFTGDNQGNVTAPNGSFNYNLDNGGGVPRSGSSVSIDVVITQYKPTI
jgi:hypothetical protein